MERLKEKLAIKLAWLLPRQVAYWAFIRVSTEGSNEYPAEQRIMDIQTRWNRSNS